MKDLLPYLLTTAILSAGFTFTITWYGLRRRAWRIEIESWKAARRYYSHLGRPF